MYIETYQGGFLISIECGRVLKCFNTVPAVSCCEHLSVETMSEAEDELPESLLGGEVNPILNLVKKKDAAACGDERQRNTQHTVYAVTQTAKCNWLGLRCQLRDWNTVAGTLTDKRYSLNLWTDDTQCLDDILFEISQRN